MKVLRSLFEDEDLSYFGQLCEGLKMDDKFVYLTKSDYSKIEEAVMDSPQLVAEESLHYLILIKAVALFNSAPKTTIQEKIALMTLATEIYNIDKEVGLALLAEIKVE